jgi:DNA-binding MarR family transcriptional regulator
MKSLRLILEVHRATHRIGLYLDAADPPLEVSQGEAHLLAWLLEAGDAPMSALHAAFAHKRSTLTSYVDRLEAKRLVRRELRPEDRRSFRVCLTSTGKSLAARVHRHLEVLEAAVLGGASERDVEGFTKVVAALIEASESKASRKARKEEDA